MNQNPTPSTARFERIQVLRALAAFSVLVYHATVYVGKTTHPLPFGDVFAINRWGTCGVMLFFCISGYVIAHAVQSTRGIPFLLQRLTRIYVGFLAALILAILIEYWTFGSFPWHAYNWCSVVLVPTGEENHVLLVEWTLLYENAFYIAIATLSLLSRRIWIFMAAWTLIIIANAVVGWTKPNLIHPVGFQTLLSPLCLPFAAGFMIYQVRETLRMLDSRILPAAAICFALYLVERRPWLAIAFYTAGTTLVIHILATRKAPLGQTESALAWVGDTSYGIYLLHAVIIMCASHTIVRNVASGEGFLVAICLSFGLSCLFGWFEVTLHRKVKRRFFSRGRKQNSLPEPVSASAQIT